jgi:hypothetical protein
MKRLGREVDGSPYGCLRISGTIPLFPLYFLMPWTRPALPFTLAFVINKKSSVKYIKSFYFFRAKTECDFQP